MTKYTPSVLCVSHFNCLLALFLPLRIVFDIFFDLNLFSSFHLYRVVTSAEIVSSMKLFILSYLKTKKKFYFIKHNS